MSCVNYWNECEACKVQTYDRLIKSKCESCGSTKMDYIKECDEDFDEMDRMTDYFDFDRGDDE